MSLFYFMASFGSGSDVIGTQAVQAALARRQQGGSVPALNQQSAAAPTSQPNMVQPPPSAPTSSAIPQGMQQAPQTPPQPNVTPGLPQGSPEARIILDALSGRLKTINKLETSQVGGV